MYTALAWRNKSFGKGAEFVWAAESNDFAVRETRPDVIKVYKNFKVSISGRGDGLGEPVFEAWLLRARVFRSACFCLSCVLSAACAALIFSNICVPMVIPP